MMRTTTADRTTATGATSDAATTPLLRLLLRRVPRAPLTLRAAVLAGVWLGAAAIAASAVIHLHLWLIGYRNIHLIGPAFMFQVVSGLVLAVILVAYPRLISVAAGVGFLGGSAVALLLSATIGFLGLHDPLTVPWATPSLVIELAGFVVLLGSAAVMLWRR